MQSTTIQLPGSGQPSAMFAFDVSTPVSTRLMNLQPLNAVPSAERWFAPGPCEVLHDGPNCTITSQHYQLRTLLVQAPATQIREITHRAYRTLLAAVVNSTHPQLARIWNYVPQINLGADDSEVYRQFCWGRSEAFEAHDLALPAATAIGSHDQTLRISLLSTTNDTMLRHTENPRQVSAYRYPKKYGPRSPSFARATWIERDNSGLLLLSGTSSIVEHSTLHNGNLRAQVAETKRNIDHLIASLPNQIGLAGQTLAPRAMRFYLRDAAAFRSAQQAYVEHFADYPAAEFFVADICRSDLSMEVEGVFSNINLNLA